jgi:hypothetical protein
MKEHDYKVGDKVIVIARSESSDNQVGLKATILELWSENERASYDNKWARLTKSEYSKFIHLRLATPIINKNIKVL